MGLRDLVPRVLLLEELPCQIDISAHISAHKEKYQYLAPFRQTKGRRRSPGRIFRLELGCHRSGPGDAAGNRFTFLLKCVAFGWAESAFRYIEVLNGRLGDIFLRVNVCNRTKAGPVFKPIGCVTKRLHLAARIARCWEEWPRLSGKCRRALIQVTIVHRELGKNYSGSGKSETCTSTESKYER